jgi:hypothetical protein
VTSQHDDPIELVMMATGCTTVNLYAAYALLTSDYLPISSGLPGSNIHTPVLSQSVRDSAGFHADSPHNQRSPQFVKPSTSN